MFLICLTAFIASGLTLFSGFGLGTILMPVFAIFFPVEIAVGLTAIVHLLNNLFKTGLLGRRADVGVIVRFGLPAIATAFVGAWLLTRLTHLSPVLTYSISGKRFEVTPIKLVIAMLMIVFAILEISPTINRWQIPRKYMPVGGMLSGFFGGLSGHQGALRSAFLVRAGLTKETFIATGVVIACMVDVSRLAVYATDLPWSHLRSNAWLMVVATLSAFGGAFLGTRLITKVTLAQVQKLVAAMLILLAIALGLGVI